MITRARRVDRQPTQRGSIGRRPEASDGDEIGVASSSTNANIPIDFAGHTLDDPTLNQHLQLCYDLTSPKSTCGSPAARPVPGSSRSWWRRDRPQHGVPLFAEACHQADDQSEENQHRGDSCRNAGAAVDHGSYQSCRALCT